MEPKNQQLRFSSFTKIFFNGDVVAYYHSLLGEVCFMSLDYHQLFQKAFSQKHETIYFLESVTKEQLNILDFLVNNTFLVPETFSEYQQICDTRDRILNFPSLDIMYLLLTDSCNLCCKYCFLESPDAVYKNLRKPMGDMTLLTACKAVDVFFDLTRKYSSNNRNKFIQFYGGEPLINFSVLRGVTEYIQKKNMEFNEILHLVLITNATLVTDEIAKFLADNKIAVGVSLDGPRDIHDAYRMRKGIVGGTYNVVMENIKRLRDAGVQVGISCTLTPLVMDHYEELISFLVSDVGVQDGFSFNILHYAPEVLCDEIYFEKVANGLIYSFNLLREKGIYEEKIMRRVQSYVSKTISYSDCGATGNQIVVAPNGDVGVCQDFLKSGQYFYDNVFNDLLDPFQNEIFLEWRKRSPLFMKECFDCPSLSLCGGGCPASAEIQFGNKWCIDTRICPYTKKILEWLIWDQFNSFLHAK